MTNKEKYAQKMISAGVCDERGAAFCATAVKLPDGSFGMCLLGVKGNELSIYDTDMKSSVGELLYTIPLRNISVWKSPAVSWRNSSRAIPSSSPMKASTTNSRTAPSCSPRWR